MKQLGQAKKELQKELGQLKDELDQQRQYREEQERRVSGLSPEQPQSMFLIMIS